MTERKRPGPKPKKRPKLPKLQKATTNRLKARRLEQAASLALTAEIKAAAANGYSLRDIAANCGMSSVAVHHILRRRPVADFRPDANR